MTDPICRELQSDLHAVTLGEGIACDYHERPKELAIDESVLAECIRVVDHPQLSELPEGWIVDAARCSTHAVAEIVEPTGGFEEALVQLPVTESNNVVSVDVPEIEAIHRTVQIRMKGEAGRYSDDSWQKSPASVVVATAWN